MSFVGPAALCRLDDALLARIRRGEGLPRLVASTIVTIVFGAGAYGVAFGIWRGSKQAVFSALKLPTLLLAIAASTIGLGAMLALLLRSKLAVRQTVVCILLSLAVTAAVLGAAAPASILLVESAPLPDPSIVGLAITDPRAQPSLEVARGLLVLHVAVVAFAGMAGVIRLRALLTRLGLGPRVARRVLVAWMATQFFCGAELSWVMRPFFGRPHLPETLSCDDLLKGSFFEELATAARSAFGPFAPVLLVASVLVVAGVLVGALRDREERVTIAIGEGGLRVDGGPRTVGWHVIETITLSGCDVRLVLRADESFVRDVLTVACDDEEGAVCLARRLDEERSRVREGPFRTSAR